MQEDFQNFDDQNIRKSRIEDIYNSFSRIPRDCFTTVVASKTEIIPFSKFERICCEVEDMQDLPRNLARMMLAIHYKRNPRVVEKADCNICDSTGLELHEIFKPYTRWVSPCKCLNGKRFEWMNRKKDGALEDTIRKQTRLEGDTYGPESNQESMLLR